MERLAYTPGSAKTLAAHHGAEQSYKSQSTGLTQKTRQRLYSVYGIRHGAAALGIPGWSLESTTSIFFYAEINFFLYIKPPSAQRIQEAASTQKALQALEKSTEKIEDAQLLADFNRAESSERAFRQLIGKYQQRVYLLVRKMVIDHDDADDVVQEVFIKVWKNIHEFEGGSQLFTWIYRIATNECLRFLARKKKKRFWISMNDVSTELATKIDTAPHIGGSEVQRKLQKALLRLPDKQRLVFNLKYYEDLRYDEMAEITGTSVGGLKASYHHAVKKIQKNLKMQIDESV